MELLGINLRDPRDRLTASVKALIRAAQVTDCN